MQTTPVSPVEHAGHRYIVAGFANADWVKNARAAGWGLLGKGPEPERVRLTELQVGERSPVLKAFVTNVRGGRGFINVPPAAPLAAFAEVADRFPVFRTDAGEAGGSKGSNQIRMRSRVHRIDGYDSESRRAGEQESRHSMVVLRRPT